MKRKLFVVLATFVMSTALPIAVAHADSVTFSINNPTQYTVDGDTLIYTATVTAAASNGADIFLNGDDINSTLPFPIDDSPFYNNFPFSLDPGQSYTGELFDVVVPLGTPIADYSGTFVLLGGPDGDTFSPLGTAAFSTNVTPEPSSLLLLATGLLGGAASVWRRRTAFAR